MTPSRWPWLVWGTALLGAFAAAAAPTITNVSSAASGGGVLPVIMLDQGSAAGLYDGVSYAWGGGATSPRTFSGSSIQPYLTWSAPQVIGSVRVFGDYSNINHNYDRVRIDTLVGSDPTQEANWVQRYDSNVTLNKRNVDAFLAGGPYSTQGVRVRVSVAATDTNVGEIQAFTPFEGGTTLTSRTVALTSPVATSFAFRAAAGGANGDFYDGGWMSDTAAANPGTSFDWSATVANATVNGVGIIWFPQGGWASMPSRFTVRLDTGAGYFDAATLTVNPSVYPQFYMLPAKYDNVQGLMIRVAESDISGNPRVSFQEVEAYYILPEPAGILLLALGCAGMVRRRR